MKTYKLIDNYFGWPIGTIVPLLYWEGKGKYLKISNLDRDDYILVFLRSTEPDPTYFEELKNLE